MPINKSWPGYNKGTIPDDGFEWLWQEAIPANEPNRPVKVATIPFGYEKRVLPRGWQKTPENMPLELDIIFEKDVEIILRDGVKVSSHAARHMNLELFSKLMLDLRRHLSSCRNRRKEDSHHHTVLSIW